MVARLVACLLCLLMLMFIPALSTWLPRLLLKH